MADWLRPVWGRSKTPTPALGFIESFSSDHNDGDEGSQHQLRPVSRVSSFIGLNSSSAEQIPEFKPSPWSNRVRYPDDVYHNPSLDQIVEMLQVGMMNQSSFDPLPIQFNSCILHILEGYYKMKCEIAAKDKEIQKLNEARANDIQEFERLTSQLDSKERDYITEIKNLEILLSRTEGGLEKVALARTNSKIHGSKRAAEDIRKEVGIIRQQASETNSRDRGYSASSADNDGDDSENRGFTRNCQPSNTKSHNKRYNSAEREKDPNYPRIVEDINSSDISQTSSLHKTPANGHADVVVSPQIVEGVDDTTPRGSHLVLSKAQVEALERQQSIQELGVYLGSDTDSESTNHSDLELPPNTQRRGLGVTVTDRSFLPRPGHRLSDKTQRNAHFPSREMGFSFRPGDDSKVLAPPSSRACLSTIDQIDSRRTQSYDVPKRKSERSNTAPEQLLQIPVVIEPPTSPKKSKSSDNLGLAELSSATALPRYDSASSVLTAIRVDVGSPRDESLRRYDSSSSIVTAVRDISGRNSPALSQNGSHAGRPKLDRSSGSEAAVTAAARAFAARFGGKKVTESQVSGLATQKKAAKRGRI